MTSITVQAIYANGLLKPTTRLNLPEGVTVQVQITVLPLASSGTPSAFGSLAGVWSHLADTEVYRIEQDLVAMRRQTNQKVERLAREISSDPGPHDG
jgi:predicted DNA-binding antitoxin AbrB/MazE fold protein